MDLNKDFLNKKYKWLRNIILNMYFQLFGEYKIKLH